MKVLVDFGDGTEEEELEVTDGSMHFHPYEDGEKHDVTVVVLEDDEGAPGGAPEEIEATEEEGFDPGLHTVQEVMDEANASTEDLYYIQAIRDSEAENKARTTLLAQLDALIESLGQA